MPNFRFNCCDHRFPIAQADCSNGPEAGIYDVRIACRYFVTFTEQGCDTLSGDGMPDGKVTAIVTEDPNADPGGPEPLFYTVDITRKSGEWVWSYNFDPDTNTLVRNETIQFTSDVQDIAFFCIIKDLIGQDVVVLFRRNGTDAWFMAGREGGLTVNEISGGSGTTEFVPTTFVISGEDIPEIAIQVLDTDQATTDTMIDGITAS
jgi:hypothetical protein